MSQRLRMGVVLVMACGLAVPAGAQEHDGARISGFYSGAIGEGETNVSAGGSVGYRFTPHFGFDFEALALPDLEIDNRGEGRGVAFLTNFVTEFPSPAAWLTPYIQGGGGVANLRFGSTFEYEDRDGRRFPVPARNGRRGVPAAIDDMRVVRTGGGRSETSLALSLGGGVDFSIWRGLSLGPNITFMKLFGGQDTDLTRIGAKASYRF
jgi:opacity protein-like surface antigen